MAGLSEPTSLMTMESKKRNLRVTADAKSDVEAIEFSNKVWSRVLRAVKHIAPRRYELVVDGVKKSGYVYMISTRVGSKLVRFTLILRAKSSKQIAAYFGKSGVDIIELNCLPKSSITTTSILRSLSESVRIHFVHEFQHYLDARKFKSKKRYEKHVRDIEKQSKRGGVSDAQYFNFDLERNTHYAEIVHELRLKMSDPKFSKRIVSFQKFIMEAKKLQKDFFANLTHDNRKRILARLYGVYQLMKGNDMSKQSKAFISVGGYVVGAEKKAGPGRLFTESEVRERGREAFRLRRKRGLKVWEALQKSNLFPRGRYQTPPEGYVRACYSGRFITAENGDQWECDVGIKGYLACYVTPAGVMPFKMLDDDMQRREPPRGIRYVDK